MTDALLLVLWLTALGSFAIVDLLPLLSRFEELKRGFLFGTSSYL
jgi:hypothetical protein